MENKLGITEGLAIVEERYMNSCLDVYIGEKRACEFKSFSDKCFNDTTINEADANAKLYVDAHNTANKCGKLPSQLLQENEEMKAMLEEFISVFNEVGILNTYYFAEEFEQLLNKINQ